MKTPYASVVIDTYNYGRYVEDAVESVLAQEFPLEEREILVVDDGSTDDTEERLRKYGDGIRYLQKPNGGQASAFNCGFERARGQVIALLDADDVWLPSKLGRVSEAFEQNPGAGMVYHRVYWWEETNKTLPDKYFVPVSGRVPENRSDLLKYPMSGASSLTFRRGTLQELTPIPEALRTQADAYLTALVIFVAPVVALPESLANYRIHDSNQFQVGSGTQFRSRIEYRMAMRDVLFKEVRCWLKGHGHDLRSSDLQDYLKQWARAQEADSYLLDTPGRWEHFRHLLEHPRIYGINMSARHRAYSYLRAVAALFLGYDRLHIVDDVRGKYKQLFNLPFTGSVADENEKAAASKI